MLGWLAVFMGSGIIVFGGFSGWKYSLFWLLVGAALIFCVLHAERHRNAEKPDANSFDKLISPTTARC
jgi:hypothetical protein